MESRVKFRAGCDRDDESNTYSVTLQFYNIEHAKDRDLIHSKLFKMMEQLLTEVQSIASVQ